jgi:DNA-binding LacI/PurR family transcriptional regulator
MVDPQHFADQLEDGHARIERSVWILKDHAVNCPVVLIDNHVPGSPYDAIMDDAPFPAIEMPLTYDQTAPDRKELPQWLSNLLSRSPRPTALFCNVDFYAVHIISALNVLGYRVPEDISVVGFDDLEIAQMIHPQLTTVRINRNAMSQIAVARLIARIEGDDSPPLTIHVGSQIIVRESSASATP